MGTAGLWCRAFSEAGRKAFFQPDEPISPDQLIGEKDQSRLIERVTVRLGVLADNLCQLRVAQFTEPGPADDSVITLTLGKIV